VTILRLRKPQHNRVSAFGDATEMTLELPFGEHFFMPDFVRSRRALNMSINQQPTVGRRAFSVAGARVWSALLPTSLQHLLCSLSENVYNCISFHSPIQAWSTKSTFSPCVILVQVAFCYLGHPKNLLID